MYIYIHPYVYTYIHIHTQTYAHICIYVCIQIYIYINVYIHFACPPCYCAEFYSLLYFILHRTVFVWACVLVCACTARSCEIFRGPSTYKKKCVPRY